MEVLINMSSQKVRFQLLRGTTQDWTSESGKYKDLILKVGEPAVNIDTGEMRIATEENQTWAVAVPVNNLNIVNGNAAGSIQQKGFVYNDSAVLGAIASGEGAVAFGGQRFDKVGNPVSEEPQTEAKGKQSFAAGGGVLVNGNWSAGFGKDNIVDGKAAFSVGGGNIVKEVLDNDGNVSYSFSIALGESNEVHGRSSVALGSTNHLEKFGSYSIGYGNKIYGKQSGALGTGNQIDAENATSIGHSNFIHNLHNFSTLIGTGLKSSTRYQTVSGRFNALSGGVFGVGTGNNDEDRKNAFIVMEDGRAKVHTAPVENNDIVRLAELKAVQDTLIYATNAEILALWA